MLRLIFTVRAILPYSAFQLAGCRLRRIVAEMAGWTTQYALSRDRRRRETAYCPARQGFLPGLALPSGRQANRKNAAAAAPVE